jgi:hypothetical protein
MSLYSTGMTVLTGNFSGYTQRFTVLNNDVTAYYIDTNGRLYPTDSSGGGGGSTPETMTYYVRSNGNDSATGNNTSQMFKTFAKAASMTVPSGYVHKIIITGPLDDTSEHGGGQQYADNSVFVLKNESAVKKRYLICGEPGPQGQAPELNARLSGFINANHRALAIIGNIEVTFQRITITGGLTTSAQGRGDSNENIGTVDNLGNIITFPDEDACGGGIYAEAWNGYGPTIILGSGAVVTRNLATGAGNGIYASGASITMQDGAAVINNDLSVYSDQGVTPDANLYGGYNGAGIYLKSSTLTMVNATISGNASRGPGNSDSGSGAGIYLASGSQLNMRSGAVISGNGLYRGTAQYGSAIYATGGSTVFFYLGSEVTGNTCSCTEYPDRIGNSALWGPVSGYNFLGGRVHDNIYHDYPLAWGFRP